MLWKFFILWKSITIWTIHNYRQVSVYVNKSYRGVFRIIKCIRHNTFECFPLSAYRTVGFCLREPISQRQPSGRPRGELPIPPTVTEKHTTLNIIPSIIWPKNIHRSNIWCVMCYLLCAHFPQQYVLVVFSPFETFRNI